MRSFSHRWLRSHGPWYILVFALTLLTLVFPIYTITDSVSAGSISQHMAWHYRLGNSFQNSTQCSGPIRCTNSSLTQSYSAGRMPHVGSLMQLCAALWIVGIVALLGALVIEALRVASESPRPLRREWLAGVVAAAALLSPILLTYLFLPRDVNADRVAFPNSGSGPGPWASFAGSSQSGGIGIQWGPALGWILLLAAGTLLVLVILWSWYDLGADSDRPSDSQTKET
ncbi:MAG: hypothetical protein ACYCPN_01225 [Thermoplasmata archaeon]